MSRVRNSSDLRPFIRMRMWMPDADEFLTLIKSHDESYIICFLYDEVFYVLVEVLFHLFSYFFRFFFGWNRDYDIILSRSSISALN